MVTPLIDPSAPEWGRRLALNIANVFKARVPNAPEKLAPFLFAGLPPAASWPGCQVWVTDKNKVGFSNGTTWTDPSGGAL